MGMGKRGRMGRRSRDESEEWKWVREEVCFQEVF